MNLGPHRAVSTTPGVEATWVLNRQKRYTGNLLLIIGKVMLTILGSTCEISRSCRRLTPEQTQRGKPPSLQSRRTFLTRAH